MSSNYRIKVSAMRLTRDGGFYLVVDNINMRTAPGGVDINTIASGTASASSVYSSYVASNALPGQANIFHSGLTTQAAINAGNLWWRYDFNADYIFIREYTIQVRNDTWWQYDSPTAWTLEWQDFRTGAWVAVNTQSGVSWSQNELKTFSVVYDYWQSYTGRNNLTNNTNYIFKTSNSGIYIYNNSYSQVGFMSPGPIWNNFSYNVIHCDDDYLYIGTNSSGVVRSPMSSIASGIYTDIRPYKNFPDLTNSQVLDIHGYDDYICAITISGIDEINTSTGDRYYTTVSGALRCFQTASGIYYTTSGTLHAVYNLTSNWTTPDYSYNVSTHQSLFNVNYMYDLHIKDGVIYLATNNGVIVIKEERGSESSSDYKRFKEI